MKLAAFLAGVLLSIATLSAATKPLNILVFHADDWRYNTLGCAGNPVVKTPRLDQLAAEGTRFNQPGHIQQT
jgi:hypothetical protein